MKSNRAAHRTARQLLRFCLVDGRFSDDRARDVMNKLVGRNALTTLEAFARLVRLEKARRHAIVESAIPAGAAVNADILASLQAKYGADITAEFQTNPALIGGLRIKLGSDVYDGSVRARLDSLTNSLSR